MAAIVRLRREYHVVAWSIVVIIFLYFVLPIAGATEFSLAETVTETGKQTYGLDAYRMIFDYPEFIDALKVTLRLTVISVALSLVIMVPTVTMVHLGAKRYRRLVEFVSIQPLVIPPVVLVLGVLNFMPTSWKGTPNLLGFEYAILSMPFTFRALDAGLMNLDVKTIVDAARGVGHEARMRADQRRRCFRIIGRDAECIALRGELLQKGERIADGHERGHGFFHEKPVHIRNDAANIRAAERISPNTSVIRRRSGNRAEQPALQGLAEKGQRRIQMPRSAHHHRQDRKSTRLNSSHVALSRMPSSA